MIHQRHGQTDGQTTCDRNTALCTKVHRAVKKVGKIKKRWENLKKTFKTRVFILK